MTNSDQKEESLGFLNILIIILSFYVLGSLLVDTFLKLPLETEKILNYIDNAICGVFLIDFIVRLKNAENKYKFMKWGWIDLIASIPTLDFMRAGRLLRLIRLIRIFRAFRSTKHIVQHVFKNKVQGTLTSVSIIAVLMLLFSSIAILQFETDPNSNIKTAEDAIWWSYVTITTVGYGDKFPVTTEGRILAAILMTVGVGLFGTFTAYVSSWFVKDNQGHNNED
ncbi:MAG: ion transporter [Bacteroidetes bacterium RIFCSPLOWO2_12_FULL_35_15]|nr:MAG: ion transporter [Bacteroidetes bacterium RIFCSPLOWO2_12_FULL_35_15]